MIRPERDPHWCLGLEHGRDGLEPYTFQDAENQRRYVEGYGRGEIQRAALRAASPYQQLSPLAEQLRQLRGGQRWRP